MTVWMKLVGIILNEISQERKTDAACYHIHVKPTRKKKKLKSQKHRIEKWLPEDGGCGK